MIAAIEAPVGIIMPKTNPDEYDKVAARYEGLAQALADSSTTPFFAYQAESYNPETHGFTDVYDVRHNLLAEAGYTAIVRDLTVQKRYDEKPLYTDPDGPRLINAPQVNVVLAEGIQLSPEKYAGVENIGNAGLPKLELGTFNKFRMISVGGRIIGAAEYKDTESIRKDYLSFIAPADLPEAMQVIASAVHQEMVIRAGTDQNVFGIDVKTGVDDNQPITEFVKVLPKALRISEWDKQFKSTSSEATVTEMARRWDEAEATMLARLAQEA